jgi:hypothetical protein
MIIILKAFKARAEDKEEKKSSKKTHKNNNRDVLYIADE